jgi:excisionase family DNA binding protein
MNALIDREDLARELKVTSRTIGTWQREGRIPHIKIGRRTVRFDLADVVSFLKKRGGAR